MVEIGYTLSSEEFRPNELVQLARRAEEVGFSYAGISDHYHPWLDNQGHAPFVWATLGGIAQVTRRLRLVTGVTCPTVRIHPAVIAQAAATVADMLPGRFVFGVGSGENLNEHITGARWPPVSVRQEMLDEAIAVIRQLWQGGYQTHHGRHYTVENARIYTLPDELPSIYVGASGPEAAELAGQIGDGLICTSPDEDVVEAFTEAGGSGKPMYGQMTVCWAADEAQAKQTAYDAWGYTALPGQMTQELALPMFFEQGMKIVTPDMVAESIVCGPDPARYHEQIKSYVDAGFTHVYLHQVGDDQESFFRFAEREILPTYQ